MGFPVLTAVALYIIIRYLFYKKVSHLTIILLLLLTVVGALAVYYYRFIRRSFLALGMAVSLWRNRMIIALLTAALLGSCYVFPVMILALLHLLLCNELCRLLHWLLRKLTKKEPKFRLTLHRSGAVPVLLTAAILLYGYYNMHHVVQTDYRLTSPKLEQAYRVALLSDLHYGVSLDGQELEALCREISAQEPDVVILCGDLVDNNTTYGQMEELLRTLGTIESTCGTYYVYGNHDRPFYGLESAFDDADLRRHMAAAGITVLQDTVLPLADDLTLVGREDRSRNGREALSNLLSQANPDSFLLVLDHQPCEYVENAALGTDLLLSGHTHGGQIWPANLFDKLLHFNDASYGLTVLDENRHALVTSGIAGWLWPIKTSAPSEYVIIDLQPQHRSIP